MPPTKRTYKIKKAAWRGERESKKVDCSDSSSDSEDCTERPVPEHFKEETPIKRAVKMDPRQISNLSEEERDKIKEDHPEMNEYFLMSPRDKSKYFHLLNQRYRQEIKLPEPPGSAPMKKTIRFKKRFEIKPFNHHEKCEQVKVRRSFMELYRAKDDTKPKPISKLPKNT